MRSTRDNPSADKIEVSAAFTVVFEIPNTQATALIGNPSAPCSRRISAQCTLRNRWRPFRRRRSPFALEVGPRFVPDDHPAGVQPVTRPTGVRLTNLDDLETVTHVRRYMQRRRRIRSTQLGAAKSPSRSALLEHLRLGHWSAASQQRGSTTSASASTNRPAGQCAAGNETSSPARHADEGQSAGTRHVGDRRSISRRTCTPM